MEIQLINISINPIPLIELNWLESKLDLPKMETTCAWQSTYSEQVENKICTKLLKFVQNVFSEICLDGINCILSGIHDMNFKFWFKSKKVAHIFIIPNEW